MKIKITENSLRDGVQSLLATRVSTDDMLEVARIFEGIGFHSVEVWGGATYDACLRYLNEDPFERLAKFKEIFKTTPMQMLLRGANLVGYRHYAPDVIKEFIKLSAQGGIEIFRIFDALNDCKNVAQCIEEVRKNEKHTQGAICYTTSPVHNREFFISYAKELVKMGAQSLAIKDMAGLLRPLEAYELVKAIKEEIGVELSVHIHATTGFAFGSLLKAIEAGADIVDTSNSALSGGTSHPSTQAIVATLQGSKWDTQLDLNPMERASKLLKAVREKYHCFESSFNQVDTEILLTQIPGGMISNLANQLKEQNALDKMNEVAQEIVSVRKDFGYIPLVTPTSQIVGTQAVLNVLQKERYKTLTTESKNLLLGFYGKTPAPVNCELLERLSTQELPLLPSEELSGAIKESQAFAKSPTDIISYALFGEVAKNFLLHRGKTPKEESKQEKQEQIGNDFVVEVAGKSYEVCIQSIVGKNGGNKVKICLDGEQKEIVVSSRAGEQKEIGKNENAIYPPMAGVCIKVLAKEGQSVKKGDVLGVIEAMKMENEILSDKAGVIEKVCVGVGESVDKHTILFLVKG